MSYIIGTASCKKYSSVNYDQLLASIENEKVKGHHRLARVKQLTSQVKESKNSSLLNRHRSSWIKMHNYLKKQFSECQLEIEKWRSNCFLNESSLQLKDFLLDIVEKLNDVQLKVTELKKSHTHRLHRLQKELKKSEGLSRRELINEVKRIQVEEDNACLILTDDAFTIMTELRIIENEFVTKQQKESSGLEGVAEEVWSLDCPSDDLRQLIANEFIKLEDHFKVQLDALCSQLNVHCSQATDSQWASEDDHNRFKVIFQQYSSRERSLLIDRLRREFPLKSRQDIINYEDWYCSLKYYQNQKEVVLSSWKNRREELLERMKLCYLQAREEWDHLEMLQIERQQQKELCKKLAQKVALWHQKCLILQKEEQELAASELTNHKELIKEEKKRRAEKEKRKKEQLKAYHSQKEQDRLKELAEHNERIDIMRQEIEEQRKKDKERVDHRHNLYHLKLQEKEMENDQIIQRELEKEARLENLRKSVRIEATHDPDRLISQTQVWINKSFEIILYTTIV
jgi:hypothetical protein